MGRMLLERVQRFNSQDSNIEPDLKNTVLQKLMDIAKRSWAYPASSILLSYPL